MVFCVLLLRLNIVFVRFVHIVLIGLFSLLYEQTTVDLLVGIWVVSNLGLL